MGIISNITDIFKPVLSDRTILKYNKKGLLIEGELSKYQIQPNSVDLTLGTTFKTIITNGTAYQKSGSKRSIYKDYPNKDHIDPSKPMKFYQGSFKDSIYIIKPGEFVLMASNEILNIPNGILGFVQGRSSIARLGIQTEQAGLIDAGFRGTITFEVFNQSGREIILYPGMRIAQAYFFKAQRSNITYDKKSCNKYCGQIEANESKSYMDPELRDYSSRIK